jgi:hypothetical protein
LGFSQASATVRLVCAAWKAVYDAMVMRLVLREQTTDQAMGMLVRRSPAVVSLKMKSTSAETLTLTDQGVHAVSTLASLTYLDLSRFKQMTEGALQAVSNPRSLTSSFAAVTR